MKRISEYKKLFNVENNLDLKTLKSTYRNLVKEWHPDKFQSDDALATEAELKSRQIIDGYHFLVSLAPETIEANKEEYITSTNSGIDNYKHKGLFLEMSFVDGSSYEFFGVPKSVFTKFTNSDKQLRFAKRNIFNTYLYRQSKKGSLVA
ncbi:MAG: KTSC domain-containing protein [Prolixibacteraceae bacterium]|jgi:DnaJ-class molecular chaperone|nr:KTSC domain-containing protein [Prolixibacteraceae bacterium]